MINPRDDMPGVMLTEPERRGRIRVLPIRDALTGSTKALRVHVFTETGTQIRTLRATQTEVTIIDVPNPRTGALDKRPGALWFYDAHGSELGFMPDHHRAALLEPMATERPRQGPHPPQKVPS